MYLLNEGNFQRGNSTLSYYLPDSATVYADVFKAVNGRDLGDTGNSITIHGGRVYLVMNGSNTIEVIDTGTHRSVKTIACAPGGSPRAIVFDASGTGYISNLYTNSVSVYDEAANAITGDIPVGDNPEQLLAAAGRVFVTNSGYGNGNTVSVINAATKTVERTLHVGDGPSAIIAVGANTAAVLCTGAFNDFSDPKDDTPGMLYLIDLAARSIADSILLGGHPQRLAADGQSNLYTVHEDGITRIALATKTVGRAFIPGSFYSITHDAKRDLLCATDALDFAQPGLLKIYRMDGVFVRSFGAGVIPGAMAFTK